MKKIRLRTRNSLIYVKIIYLKRCHSDVSLFFQVVKFRLGAVMPDLAYTWRLVWASIKITGLWILGIRIREGCYISSIVLSPERKRFCFSHTGMLLLLFTL